MAGTDANRFTETLNSYGSEAEFVSFKPNTIYCGDCTQVLARFPEACVDLIYADPPFFSNQPYEILWGDSYERRAFEDRWEAGIQNYLKWMEPKLRLCHTALKQTGSMYLHCDWHAGHYLKVVLDRIFGENHLVNQIIWKRTSAHTGEGKIRRYGTVHDTILFYAKSDDYVFNPQYVPLEEGYVERFYKFTEKDGRRFRLSDLTGAGIRHGETGKPWREVNPTKIGRHWAFPPTRLDDLAREGRIHFTKKLGGVPSYKRYLDEMKGQLVQDIWADIPPIQSHSGERLGYPTQKPEKLLERIIEASSNPNDIVLDPFCGCGTTLAAAQGLKDQKGNPAPRRWVGIDVSPTACKLMVRRLASLHVPISNHDIIGLPRSLKEIKAMEPFEFQNWVFEVLGGRVNPRKVGDMGIDGWVELDMPLQVKQQENVGRVDVDKFETALQRAGKNRGVIVAFSFGAGAIEEVARAKNNQGLEIALKTVEEILKET